MTNNRIIFLISGALFVGGCSGCSHAPGTVDTERTHGTDSEKKKDSETVVDTGTTRDTQFDTVSHDSASETETTDTGSDTQPAGDTDSDSQSDTDTKPTEDSDSGTGRGDTDKDTDTGNPWVPPGCELVTSFRGEWSGENAVYGDMMVWGEVDPETDCQIVKLRKLSTKETIDITDCELRQHVTLWKDYIYWDRKLDGANSFSRELYRASINTQKVERLTENDTADFLPLPGEKYVVYLNETTDDTVSIKYMDLASREVFTITDKSRSNPNGYDFDGERWVVWVYNDFAYKYDLSAKWSPVVLDRTLDLSTWPKIDDGKVYSGSWTDPVDPEKKCDVHIHDLSTEENTWAFTKPFDQIQPSASGNVVAYLTTEELGTGWLSDPAAHIEIYDLKTGVSRRITDLPEVYYTVVLHGKYLAWGAGEHTLFLCDLEAGGFIDASGRVIKEGTSPDAGVDGGADGGARK